MNNTEDTKSPELVEQKFASPVYDQFAAITGDLTTDARMMRVMRVLRKEPLTEGALACWVGSRVFLPDWAPMIAKLVELGYVRTEPAKKGLSRVIHLEEKGEQFLHDRLDPKPPQPVPDAEKPGAAFERAHLEVTGKPFSTE
ncbi:hypothetical protein SBA1_100064 [Candidatus Sulfotelmatobacter kueseliae]|uniref:Uncharacterized protein n=1 Tax=Candidatus Sulfotelmatobacter kueseliae TaxID=2042962 RepID=A0A2U3JWB0_9BACT|nr:hypothetical protein SBA1_100064 [Candidatus Sulfotelmatobacter kueseliae]